MRFRDWIESRTGFKVGVGTGLKTVVNSDGELHQAGTKVTSTAAELNKLDNLTGEMVLKAVTGVINYNVATPFTVSLGTVPNGAIIAKTVVEVITVFNAATTNVLIVGTDADDDAYVTAADVAEGSTGTTTVARSATLGANTEIKAKYTQTGAAATTGSARVTVYYLV